MCLTEGEITAYLDHELPLPAARAIEEHVAGCPACAAATEKARWDGERAWALLDRLRVGVQGVPVDTKAAWRGMKDKMAAGDGVERRVACSTSGGWFGAERAGDGGSRSKEGGFFMAKWRKVATWAAVVVLAVGVFGFTPARSLGAQFLGLFRISQVEVVPFNPEDAMKLREAMEGLGPVDLENFGRVETQRRGVSAERVPVGAVSGKASFTPVLPARAGDYTLAGDEVTVTAGSTVSISPNVDGINDFLRGLGSERLLPLELEDRTFTVVVPDVVEASYVAGEGLSFLVTQAPAPTITAPAGVDVAAIRDALLEVPIVPADLKRALESVDNWQNTMIIPDFGGGNVREVMVNGVQGVFLTAGGNTESVTETRRADGSVTVEKRSGYATYGTLAWPHGDIWTVLKGQLSLDEALALAEAFR